MQLSMQKYRKRMLTLSIMLLVIILLSGVSYAIFTNYVSQTDANTLAASCMDLDFNGQNEINLTNTYPVQDGEALEKTPYTFTIKNKCDNYIEYYVIASVINTSNILDSKYVKVSLLGDSDLTSSPITNLETIATPQSLSEYNITSNYILKKGDGISKDESRTFNFRMWINGALQDSWTSEDVENKNYQVKISVVGTVKTRPKDDLFIATTIDGKASSTFPETNNYTATVACTQDNKTVDIGAQIKWTGSKWSLSVSNLTSGNTKCVVVFDEAVPAPNGWYSAADGTLLASLRDNNTLKTPLTTPGKEVSAYTKDDVTNTYTSTVSLTTSERAYYFTYGTGYKANGSNFDLTGTAVADKYSTSYSSLVGKYLVNVAPKFGGSSTAGTMVTTTNLSEIYYVVSTTSEEITYKTITSNKNTTEALLASTEDDYGTSYYFRGAVKNNYVQFANKCWRIVRINGDGSIKLVLHNDNTSVSSISCSSANNSDTAAFARYSGTTYESAFNSSYNDNAYIGFRYGTTGSSAYASTHANTNKSTILTNLETWYTNNLASYESKLADTIWCNDKSTVSGGLGYGQNATEYATGNRIRTNQTPSLICPNDNNGGKLSKFTASDTTNGNGNLTYKIGLLTVDELAFAGYMADKTNLSTYLQENTGESYWWTLSPSTYKSLSAFIWNVQSGNLYISNINASANYSNSLRPAISLISDIEISDGTGTSEDPYIINS